MLFDLIVIGSGPAGQKAALQGAKSGKSVAIIEDHPSCLGGGCVHSGTLPSKSFRESVYRWSLGSRGILGQESEKPQGPVELPDMKRLLRRCNRVVADESQVVFDQLKRNGVKIYHGRGKLLNANEVEVDSKKGKEKLTASVIIIAVGARPVAPKHLAVDGKTILDSNSILGLKELPKRLVVLGAGIIGCEYASMFSMAGTEVYLIDRRNEILANVDREIVNHLVERFIARDVEILLDTEAVRIEKNGGSASVVLSNERTIEADKVLIALGRFGNSDGMGLEEVGVEKDERGLIKVDRHYRTTVPNIYAVGDVIGQPALASTSMEEGRIACCHAFGIEETTMSPFFPYGIYTIPEISMIGATEEELIAQKADFIAGRAHYREIARGQIVGDRSGLLKLLVDAKTKRLLGIHIVGDNAAELVHIGQAVMALGGDVQYFITTVFNYPTLAEAYKTAAFHALNQLRARSSAGQK